MIPALPVRSRSGARMSQPPSLRYSNRPVPTRPLRDAAGNEANLSLPAGQNLNDNKDIVILTTHTITAGKTGNGTIAPEGGRSGISTLVSTVMPTYTPDIVLLMIGTNDAIDNYDMATAATRLKALIDSVYAQLPNVLIVVAQPIPSRGDASKGDDTALSDRIKAYDGTIPAVVKAETDAGKHILLVDMFTPFNPNKTSLLEDQWHPNLAGYVLLATQWYSVLQPLL